MNKARLAGLGVGIALIIAAFALVWWQSANVPITSVAFAQGASATATPLATTVPSTAPQQQQAQPPQAIGDTFWGILAGKLSLSVDTLKTQAIEARKQMVDQAVTDGRITQQQADQLKAQITSDNLIAPIPLPGANQGVPPFGPWGNNQNGPQNNNQNGGHRHPGFGNGGNGNKPFPGGILRGRGMAFGLEGLDSVASALKLDSKALVEQLSQGKTLADIATAQGVDQATVKQAIITARTAEIDKLLSLGIISEVQANKMKARLTPDSIDLSKPLFRMRSNQGGQQSFGTMPDDFMGLMFGQGGNGMFHFFQNDQTAPSGGTLTIPGADIQTQ